jgi:type III restriction enzyme
MRDLVSDTLVSKGGSLKTTVIQDGAVFQVVRGPGTAHQPVVTYPNGSEQTITVKELRSLFPAVIYSQGELSEIGKQTGRRTQLTDLLQFVNTEYKREDDRLIADVRAKQTDARAAVQGLVGLWILQAQLRGLTTSRNSLKERISALEKTLPDQSPDDQAKIEYFDKATEFDGKRAQASKHADDIVSELRTVARELLNPRDLATELGDEVEAVQQKYSALYDAFKSGLEALKTEAESLRSELAEAETEWAVRLTAARGERDAALEKLGEHKAATTQIIRLREQLTEINGQIAELQTQIDSRGDPSELLKEKLEALRGAVRLRVERTQSWADEIEQLSSAKIKANVESAGDMTQIKEAIDQVAAKTGSQEGTRLQRMEDALKTKDVWDWLDELRTDCLALLYWQQLGAAQGEERPECTNLFDLLGETEKIKSSLAERIDSARVETITAATPHPEITLFYCDGDREIAFEKASEGQRAAALLFMLLEQEGGPLIIDQPEGDLDNKIISELTEKLHDAKKKRQLIFASHNANIVVNGSSELVGYLEVKDDGTRRFESAGAIDEQTTRKLITETMEGGERAFRDRQDKYGY